MKAVRRGGLSGAHGCQGSKPSGLRRSMRVRRSLLGAAVVWTFIGSVACYASDGEELIRAATQGDLALVTTLLAQGADVNAKGGADGITALFMASLEGHSEVVTALLAQGADVDARTAGGGTALMEASGRGYSEVVTALLAQGADVNARGNDGATALTWASQQGHSEVEKLLKEAGGTE